MSIYACFTAQHRVCVSDLKIFRQFCCHLDLRLARENLLCLLSELYTGTDEYRDAIEEAVAKVKQRAGYTNGDIATAKEEVDKRLRDSGPCSAFVQLPMFKAYAMATFVVLISSAIIEGMFSEFAGLKTNHRNQMSDSTTSCCMSTRVAQPIYADPAVAFNPNPVLADQARKHRLDWWDDGCQ
eukprot:COSAG02_NODE_18761_length_920_cov_2.521315_1_plen_183_part_00